MKTASFADVKAHFGDYVKATAEGPVVVTRNGKPIVLLLAVDEEDDLESLILANSPKFQALLAASEQEIRKKGAIPHELFWKEVEEDTKKARKKRPRRKPL